MFVSLTWLHTHGCGSLTTVEELAGVTCGEGWGGEEEAPQAYGVILSYKACLESWQNLTHFILITTALLYPLNEQGNGGLERLNDLWMMELDSNPAS